MLGCLPNTFAGGPSPTPSSTDRKPGALVTLDPADNVAIAVRRIGAGEPYGRVTAREETQKGHKIALSDIEPGAQICKYAQVIGYASGAIAAGSHVHVHNVEFRNTGQDYEFCVDLRDPGAVPPEDRAAFRGFRRANGKVGTRNYVAVLTSVNCSATAARLIAAAFTPETLAQYPNVDGVVAFVHGTGRGSAYGCKPSPCIKRSPATPTSSIACPRTWTSTPAAS